MKVSVLGLGAMGLPMALQLGKSFDTRAFDLVEAARDRAAVQGCKVADTAAEAVDNADVIVVAVRDGDQLAGLLLGEDGVAQHLLAGSAVVVTSTVGQAALEEVEQGLLAHGVHCVDSAVSGGPVRALEGDLVLMVSGPEEVVETCRPVLESLASTLCVVGNVVGQGQQLKAVNQLLCGIHTAAAAEAIAFAHQLGLDLDVVLEVLGSGAAQSFMLSDRGPRMVQQLRGEEPPLRSRTDVIAKDMRIVGAMTRNSRVTAPVSGAAEQLYRLAESFGLQAQDDSVLAPFLMGATPMRALSSNQSNSGKA